MTNDTIWNVWQDGIQNLLITSLSNSGELKVRQAESITGLLQSKGLLNYASITPSMAGTISQKLDANVFVCGSINQAGSALRMNAQLTDSKTGEIFKTFKIEDSAKEENIFRIIDSLSLMLRDYLVISILEKELPKGLDQFVSTNSPEAFRYYINGINAFYKRDYPASRKWLFQAITIDSNFFAPTYFISSSYGNQGMFMEAKKWGKKIYDKKDQLPMMEQLMANQIYAAYFETPYEVIKYLKQMIEMEDQNPRFYYNLGNTYNILLQYDKAIPALKKSLEIYRKWDTKPRWVYNYTVLGYAYHKTGKYKIEKKLYRQAENDFPDDPALISSEAVLAFAEGDTVGAVKYIERFKSVLEESSASKAEIASLLGDLYEEAGVLDEAEKYIRQAATLDPVLQPVNVDTPGRLSWFLIYTGRNINEGMKLIDEYLKLYPVNSWYLATKGWGLYKQGKYKEGLELLEKAMELRPIYTHLLYLKIQEVKTAIANQK